MYIFLTNRFAKYTIIEVVVKILPLNDEYRSIVNALIEKEWTGPFVVTRGKLIDTTKIHTIIAIENKELIAYMKMRE